MATCRSSVLSFVMLTFVLLLILVNLTLANPITTESPLTATTTRTHTSHTNSSVLSSTPTEKSAIPTAAAFPAEVQADQYYCKDNNCTMSWACLQDTVDVRCLIGDGGKISHFKTGEIMGYTQDCTVTEDGTIVLPPSHIPQPRDFADLDHSSSPLEKRHNWALVCKGQDGKLDSKISNMCRSEPYKYYCTANGKRLFGGDVHAWGCEDNCKCWNFGAQAAPCIAFKAPLRNVCADKRDMTTDISTSLTPETISSTTLTARETTVTTTALEQRAAHNYVLTCKDILGVVNRRTTADCADAGYYCTSNAALSDRYEKPKFICDLECDCWDYGKSAIPCDKNKAPLPGVCATDNKAITRRAELDGHREDSTSPTGSNIVIPEPKVVDLVTDSTSTMAVSLSTRAPHDWTLTCKSQPTGKVDRASTTNCISAGYFCAWDGHLSKLWPNTHECDTTCLCWNLPSTSLPCNLWPAAVRSWCEVEVSRKITNADGEIVGHVDSSTLKDEVMLVGRPSAATLPATANSTTAVISSFTVSSAAERSTLHASYTTK